MTVAELVAEAAAELRRSGVESPDWNAERLLRHVLAWDRASFVASPAQVVADRHEQVYRRLVTERARRVPIQHLTGSQAFWKHEFHVTRDVLIPRPETELLVETALELLRPVEHPLVVDVGTGSGCIALSLAAERPDADVRATDISEAALRVARENARRLGLEQRVAFHLGELLEPVSGLEARIDLVASNPPYVDSSERAALAPEVREHEPPLALFPPGDALSIYRRLLPDALACLRPGGALVVEIAPTLAEAVASLFESTGYLDTAVAADLAGRARVVHGRRSGARAPDVG